MVAPSCFVCFGDGGNVLIFKARKKERESVFERGSQHVSFGPKCSGSFENSHLIIVFLLVATFFFIY